MTCSASNSDSAYSAARNFDWNYFPMLVGVVSLTWVVSVTTYCSFLGNTPAAEIV